MTQEISNADILQGCLGLRCFMESIATAHLYI